ncbi:MAG TPA: hypothetical protein VMJ92_03235 [Candidatus Limnocylindrales bacterium]|nr:hypothetical protein [Candidatus Limnocylindrales bacterium]
MDARVTAIVRTWLSALPPDARVQLYLLLDEICRGLDVSRHNQFGFLRLRAEFETSGELLGCSIEELWDAMAEALGPLARPAERPPSPLESLRERIERQGHPDFR